MTCSQPEINSGNSISFVRQGLCTLDPLDVTNMDAESVGVVRCCGDYAELTLVQFGSYCAI